MISDGINGVLTPPGDVAALAALLAKIAQNPSVTVDRWRCSLPRPRTMDAVVEDYLRLYAA
jgi:glycosyltransferase involved in cell wall biosynthesis